MQKGSLYTSLFNNISNPIPCNARVNLSQLVNTDHVIRTFCVFPWICKTKLQNQIVHKIQNSQKSNFAKIRNNLIIPTEGFFTFPGKPSCQRQTWNNIRCHYIIYKVFRHFRPKKKEICTFQNVPKIETNCVKMLLFLIKR